MFPIILVLGRRPAPSVVDDEFGPLFHLLINAGDVFAHNADTDELNAAEEEYVTTAIFPNDDADQYIKSGYESVTPDGRLRGYLRRRQLPRQIPIGPPSGNAVTDF